MKYHLERILMIVGFLCLTNFIFAQFGADDISDDLFEFIVVEEPASTEDEDIPPVSSVEEAVPVDEDEFVTQPVEETVSEPYTEQVIEEKVAEPVVETVSQNVVESAPVVEEVVKPVPAEPASSNTNVIGFSESMTAAATSEANSSIVEEATSGPEPSVETAVSSEPTEEEPEEEPVVEEEPVDEKAPSRSVTMKKKQYLDVTYPGEGWLYMGDENNTKTLSFKGREQKGNTTLLKFYSDRAGEALLHFCKQDILTDTYIHDYLLVIVENKSGYKQHIAAPEYVPVQKEQEEQEEEEIVIPEEDEADVAEVTEEENVEETVVEEPEVEDIVINGISLSDEPDVIFSFGDGIDFGMDEGGDDYYQQLIDEANDAFFSGNGKDAVEKAQIVIDDGSYFSDEAYYIQAQVYETNPDMLDVNKAYELYKILVDYYPESSFWSKASKRVTYLDRYYYSIR